MDIYDRMTINFKVTKKGTPYEYVYVGYKVKKGNTVDVYELTFVEA